MWFSRGSAALPRASRNRGSLEGGAGREEGREVCLEVRRGKHAREHARDVGARDAKAPRPARRGTPRTWGVVKRRHLSPSRDGLGARESSAQGSPRTYGKWEDGMRRGSAPPHARWWHHGLSKPRAERCLAPMPQLAHCRGRAAVPRFRSRSGRLDGPLRYPAFARGSEEGHPRNRQVVFRIQYSREHP